MKISTRIPVIAASAALGLFGLMASGASAQTLEITDEFTDQHCPSVTVSGTDVNGGCLGHAVPQTSLEFRKHVFGVESHGSACNMEFWGRVNEDGGGYATEATLNSCPTRQVCKDGSGEAEPWAIQGFEAVSATLITAALCTEPAGGGANEACEIDLPLAQNPGVSHLVELGSTSEVASHGISGFRCEIVGELQSETGGTHDGQSESDLLIGHI